ncbi:MAG: nucleotide exchange factor GrpE [Gammaproteobacteria bacterium]|nr:nucleotide exchange factor GrpE [Gammaproteobacteria bacterium]
MASDENGNSAIDDGLDSEQLQGDEGVVGGEMDGDDPEALKEKLASLEDALMKQKDAVVRAKAEELNVKRRAENDVSNARKFALERFVNDLLPVMDSMERGLDVTADESSDQLKSYQEGVALTLKMFEDVLSKYNVEVIEPHGEPFDPAFHQAMSMQENADCEPNTVLAVMQKGYSLSGRLVRPAMVLVSKAPA